MGALVPGRIEVNSSGVALVGDVWEPHCEVSGNILLMHGGGQRRHSWRRTGERLAGFGWRAYAFDARGHGESDFAPDGDYTSEALVGDVVTIAEGIGEPVVLAGASMGGLTALALLGRRRDLVRALVLVDAVARIEKDGLRRVQQFMLSAPDGFGSLHEAADAIAAYSAHRPRPRSLTGLRKNLIQKPDGRWYWHWDPMFLEEGNLRARTDRYERLFGVARQVDVPTLLVRGGSSDVVTAEGLAHMQALIPHARVAEVVGTGHMVAGDDNDVFTAALRGFLDSLS